ncbi:MAG: 30S ribosomal protein S1 [Candidatus Cloacimonadaceae bacterium]|jgi:small subunit ribosomal protein S1|nr:30S ribosomal protein S1 [Candidatus Cloacimonadota bacterium]MCK9242398.1 30S ribosomal protein S1 [Candidatus Cloacimonadota bacterium]MDY0127955.1 30S ribosomal protein S1 [Candidatus Cloacimonadaceae bacterium]
MLNHDQNPIDSENKIEEVDTASQSTEVETVLEKKEEPKLEEQSSEIEMEEKPEESVTEIQEETEKPQEESLTEAGPEDQSSELTEMEVEKPAVEAQEEPKAEAEEVQAEEPELKTEAVEAEDKAEKSAEELPAAEEPQAELSPEEPQAELSPEEPQAELSPEEPQAEIAPEKPQIELSPEELEHKHMLNMYEESFSNFKVGEIIEGTIVDISDKEVRVDIGFKSEGVIQISEFAYSGPPEKNSIIRVFINKIESGDGRLQLSKKKADYHDNIERIKKAFEDGSVLPGVIRRRVKGGMIVEVYGIEAFLPGSQMSMKPIPNLDQFIGKDMQFKVLNLDEEHNNIIVSRRAVMEAEAAIKREALLERIEIDTELEGEVKNITQYGAFIDLGGIDGLLHLTDMSWGKLNHPSEMLSIGDKVKVKVINFDRESNKISLGLKQLVPHPWENIEIKYPEGTRITGKVVSVKSFGAFVELEPGVEGLVHISEMSWTKKIADARKFLKTGDTINAIVLELDKENKRISLGMKQMDPNPWLTIEDRYPIGTVLNRKVKSLTTFGAFVEIEEGIDGLVHISDISWTKRIYHPREVFRKGQEVETIILSIDKATHRIALGVKQLTPDPWETLNQELPVNSEVIGKISKLIPKGVLVDVPLKDDFVEGFIPISHLAMSKLEHSEDAFHSGEELPLKVIELDMENRRLILSVKAFFFSRDPKLQEEYVAIHEQYMRERIARLQKKRAEKQQREKQAAEAAAKKAAEKAAAKAEAEKAAQEAAAKAEAEKAEAESTEAATESPADEIVTEAVETVEAAPAAEVTVESPQEEEKAPEATVESSQEEPQSEAPELEESQPEPEEKQEEVTTEIAEKPEALPVEIEEKPEELPIEKEEEPQSETPEIEAPQSEPEGKVEEASAEIEEKKEELPIELTNTEDEPLVKIEEKPEELPIVDEEEPKTQE